MLPPESSFIPYCADTLLRETGLKPAPPRATPRTFVEIFGTWIEFVSEVDELFLNLRKVCTTAVCGRSGWALPQVSRILGLRWNAAAFPFRPDSSRIDAMWASSDALTPAWRSAGGALPTRCQREQHRQTCGVLGQSSVAHLRTAELLLDDPKRMLDFGTHAAGL